MDTVLEVTLANGVGTLSSFRLSSRRLDHCEATASVYYIYAPMSYCYSFSISNAYHWTAHWCRDQVALVAWISEHQFKDDVSLLNITRVDIAQNDCRSAFLTLIFSFAPALKDLVSALTSEHLPMMKCTLLCRALVLICGLSKTIAIQRNTENCEFIEADQGDILVQELFFVAAVSDQRLPKIRSSTLTNYIKRYDLETTNDTNTLAISEHIGLNSIENFAFIFSISFLPHYINTSALRGNGDSIGHHGP